MPQQCARCRRWARPAPALLATLVVTVLAVTPQLVHGSGETAEPVVFRLFLGASTPNGEATSVASLGEYSRVGTDVIFTLPLDDDAGVAPSQLVTLPAGAVDWARTERYAESARYARYTATQADPDFARLRVEVGQALSGLAGGEETEWHLWAALQTRERLVRWIETGQGYRQHDATQVVDVMDETVTSVAREHGLDMPELRAVTMPPPVDRQALTPVSGLQEIVEQAMVVARLTPVPAERLAVLESVVVLLTDVPDPELEPWMLAALSRAERERAGELETNRQYASLERDVIAQAGRRAADADVRGVRAVMGGARERDARLGQRRPDQMAAVMTTLEGHLATAEALRLERDHWSLRAEDYRAYRSELGPHLARLERERELIDDVRLLAGPPAAELAGLSERLSLATTELGRLSVLPAVAPIHGLFRQAFGLLQAAAAGRREAVREGDLDAARDAASAAAGGLLLLDQARVRLERSLQPPALP